MFYILNETAVLNVYVNRLFNTELIFNIYQNVDAAMSVVVFTERIKENSTRVDFIIAIFGILKICLYIQTITVEFIIALQRFKTISLYPDYQYIRNMDFMLTGILMPVIS